MAVNPILAPSILAADFARLGEQIQAVEAAGADWIHIDVMDGHFVPNLSMGPQVVRACRKVTRLFLDVHLMVSSPDGFLSAFHEAGADQLTVHVESGPHLHRSLQAVRDLGVRAGVALNPATPPEAVRPVLHMVDLVLVMSVNPGFGGQAFIPEVVPKIEKIRKWVDELGTGALIQVDGGISAETIGAAQSAGCQVFVAGSSVFKHPQGIAAGMDALHAGMER